MNTPIAFTGSIFPVVILAGGHGSRLTPVTHNKVPKPLVTVEGVPFIERILLNLQKKGAREIIVCLGYQGYMIEEYLSKVGMRFLFEKFTIVHDTDSSEKTRGTAHAVRSATIGIKSPFFVLNGDTFLDVDLSLVRERFEQHKKPLVVSFRNDNQHWPSNLTLLGNNYVQYLRSGGVSCTHIDAGLYIFESCHLAEHPDENQLPPILETLGIQRRLVTWECEKRFYEINTPESLSEAENYFRASMVAHENMFD